MKEEWRDILGYEGYYQVSNIGRVKSLDRIVEKCKGNWKVKGKVLKVHDDKLGYVKIGLYKNGVRKRHSVHRLVAEAFVPNPDNKKEINHINGIKYSNNAKNLEWVTRSENVKHSYNILGNKGKHVRINGVFFNTMSEASRYYGHSASYFSTLVTIRKNKPCYKKEWKIELIEGDK